MLILMSTCGCHCGALCCAVLCVVLCCVSRLTQGFVNGVLTQSVMCGGPPMSNSGAWLWLSEADTRM